MRGKYQSASRIGETAYPSDVPRSQAPFRFLLSRPPRLWQRLLLSAGCVLFGSASASGAEPQVLGNAGQERIWAELESPADAQRIVGPAGLVELRGWAGTGFRGGHDVLVAIDNTFSVWLPSGSDVDGDGVVGERLERIVEAETLSTDAGDTILQAQLRAASHLIDRLEPARVRMGVIVFGGSSKLLAPLGSSQEQLRGALLRFPQIPNFDGTHLSILLKRSVEVLGDGNQDRNRTLILLSDNDANEPAAAVRTFAVHWAQEAMRRNIRIISFAVGPNAALETPVLREVTAITRGALFLVDQPADIIDYLPHVSLSELEAVSIENRTTGEAARAVRLFPDGTFDGYSRLREGQNRLVITLRSEAGAERELERNVFYEKRAARSPADRAAVEALLADLRARTLETEMLERLRTKQQRSRVRDLKLEVEE